MEWFFYLVLEYEMRGQIITSRLVVPSSDACQVAIRINEPLADFVNGNMYCMNTGVLSQSVKPKTRPPVDDGKPKRAL